MNALDGIRVLDFTRVLAGPFCTMMLGDMGADVIKIEQPGRGDDTRHWGPPWAGELSAYFASVNRNKRSLTLNLKNERSQSIAFELARQSHIVIENFKPGQMAAYGLDYEMLRQINPALVYCAITGYGQDGPDHTKPGYDYVIQGMSGLMSITGPSDGPSYKVGVAISDVISGLNASTAILAALNHSQRTGEGQYIDIALLDSQIAALVNIASNYLVSGEAPQRMGNEHPNIVPYQTFTTSDGEIVVAVGNDRQFATLCHIIERPELSDDARFATNPARVENRKALISILAGIFVRRSSHTWVDLLTEAGIPAGPINDIPTALNNPQIESRGLVQQTTLHDGTFLKFIGPVAKFSQTPATVRRPPPALGQHNGEILRDVLGFGEMTIKSYRDGGVI